MEKENGSNTWRCVLKSPRRFVRKSEERLLYIILYIRDSDMRLANSKYEDYIL